MVKKFQMREVKEFDPIEYYDKRIEEVQRDKDLNLIQKTMVTKYLETRKKMIMKLSVREKSNRQEAIRTKAGREKQSENKMI
ncbi:hypothetical protein J3A84_05290 [Proteiniclasticum sp. SCR006]|uniref:Uncharacterized protein n=1 Tax=Proteiniclasticum aestuarii TaxID=2817862 RepID=A0A939HBB0_9CLOT|nr:hypothetical protein [Proteiniclasticum aestuarii]MBO1264455.1 hypothetical protein [Proteiniclasticum aestuarii]